jgi:hypothetical protein
MSTYKNTSGDLTMTGDGGLATLTVNYANTVFNGSLTYTGNLSTVDDFIIVAANNTGTVTDMGLLAQTGPTTFAGLRFDTTLIRGKLVAVCMETVAQLLPMQILPQEMPQWLGPIPIYSLITAGHLVLTLDSVMILPTAD